MMLPWYKLSTTTTRAYHTAYSNSLFNISDTLDAYLY